MLMSSNRQQHQHQQTQQRWQKLPYNLILVTLLSFCSHLHAFLPHSTLTTKSNVKNLQHSLPRQLFHPAKSTTLSSSALQSTPNQDEGPSDYDPQDLLPSQKQSSVDDDEDDAIIRDELKRELLLLGSISSRGQYATPDEMNIIVDLVTQLEALNPTPDPASQCAGEWDLCLSSTQVFRSSPFFQSIRAIFGDGDNGGNASMAENAFNLHDKATSVGKVGRVRQVIFDNGTLVSEVDLEVGLMGGMPFAMKGTVVTTAAYEIAGPEAWDMAVQTTQVKKSNVPFLDQLLDDYPLEVPVGSIYETLRGGVPVAKLKTFYVDEAMRITRDQDNNFYVFCRA